MTRGGNIGAVMLAAVCLVATAVHAGPVGAIGRYTAGVRTKVVRELTRALSSKGSAAEVSGTVTYSAADCFFIQRNDEAIKVLAEGVRSPSPGDDVVVSGFPSLEGGHVVFLAKTVKKTGSAPLPAARPVAAEELVSYDRARGGLNWLRVEVKARAIGLTDSGFAVSANGVPVTVAVDDVPSFLDDCETLHPDLVIRGVVEIVLDQSTLFGRGESVLGIKLRVGSPDDVKLVDSVGYAARRNSVAVRRTLIVLASVLALALMAVAWTVLRQRSRLSRSRMLMAERKRMADDLHDTIEQHLVGAKMLVSLGRTKEATDVLVRAKREIRDIVWGLKNDDMMRLTPVEMLRQFAHEENLKGLYRVDVKLDSGLPAEMPAGAMRDLSLIVRESIGNAVKHGGAKKIAISSDPLEDGGWKLRIANDGKPFDPASAPGAAEGHFGLEGMRERARRLGATVVIEPRKAGMVVTLEKHGG